MITELSHSENPSDEFVRRIDIHELLPQQTPFVMVSRLEHFDMRSVTTSTDIAADNIFVDDGFFSAAGLIENMAQTCAARIGYINKYVRRKGIQIGFIGALRNFTVLRLPAAGERISTDVEIIEEVFGLLLAKATIYAHGETLAHSEIKIAIKD